MHHFREAVRLDRRDWVDVLEAQLHLGRAWWLVRRRRPGRLVTARSSASAHEVDRSTSAEVTRLARAIHRASSYGLFRPLCLVRALALQQLLKAHRISGGVIRVGVKLRDEELLAHAWVEWDGEVVGDDPRHTREFELLGELTCAEAWA